MSCQYTANGGLSIGPAAEAAGVWVNDGFSPSDECQTHVNAYGMATADLQTFSSTSSFSGWAQWESGGDGGRIFHDLDIKSRSSKTQRFDYIVAIDGKSAKEENVYLASGGTWSPKIRPYHTNLWDTTGSLLFKSRNEEYFVGETIINPLIPNPVKPKLCSSDIWALALSDNDDRRLETDKDCDKYKELDRDPDAGPGPDVSVPTNVSGTMLTSLKTTVPVVGDYGTNNFVYIDPPSVDTFFFKSEGINFKEFVLPTQPYGDAEFEIAFDGNAYSLQGDTPFDFLEYNPDGVRSFVVRGIDEMIEPGEGIVGGFKWVAEGAATWIAQGFDTVEPTIDVTIDVKDSINLDSNGVLPVTVESTADFDVNDIDLTSLLLGDPALDGTVAPIRNSFEDVTDDELVDLSLKFSLPELVAAGALDASSTEIMLTGSLLDGTPIEGIDGFRIVGQSSRGRGAAAVPEPKSTAMLWIGLACLMRLRRSRR
ncbi:MAG: hypothetical protein KDB27_08485 [Planctomycetales bacterium]|nr:hypothetical protein [Planctomycetales bacterium]